MAACRCSAAGRQSARQLAQLAALDLLRRGQRQRVDEGDVARRLVVGELVERMARRCSPRAARGVGRSAGSRRHDAGEHLVAAHRVGRRPPRRAALTAGCWFSTLSTSTAEMFSPLRRITFFLRSTKCRSCRRRRAAPRRRCGTSRRPRPRSVAARPSGSRRRSRGADRRRRSAPAARPARRRRTSTPSSSTRRISTNGSARPKQLRADVARLAVGHDAGGGAGLGHRPGLDQRKAEARLERRVVLAVDAGAEAEAHGVLPVALADAGAASSIAGITPR